MKSDTNGALSRITGMLLAVIILGVVASGCLTNRSMLKKRFDGFAKKDALIVVVFGDGISGEGVFSSGGKDYGSLLKVGLTELFGKRVSVLNSSRQDESYHFGSRRLEEDVLSFRPDLVIVMLGVVDALGEDLLFETHKANVERFLGILKKNDAFPIILTAPGLRDFVPDDPRDERLQEFNSITSDAAKYYMFPCIDVAEVMRDMMVDDPKAYRELFSDPIHLGEKGNALVADLILREVRAALEAESDR